MSKGTSSVSSEHASNSPVIPTWSDPLVIRIHPADDVVIARTQLVGGTTIVLLNLCVDVCYGLLDPRLRR